MSTNPPTEAFQSRCPAPEYNAGTPRVTDASLWRGLTLGDECAMADLYDRYSQLVYSAAYRVLRDPAMSEDIVQEVFLQLWRVPKSFNPAKGRLAAWLTVVSRRRAIDQLRKCKPEIDVNEMVFPSCATQLTDVAHNQFMDRIREFLNDMPQRLRVTFELAYEQGLTHGEISAYTGDPLGTTKSRIRQSLIFIRTNLESNDTVRIGNGHLR